MDGTERLYQLYCQYVERQAESVLQMNGVLMSFDSAILRIKKLDRTEFLDRIKANGRNPEIKRFWLNRIVRGCAGGKQLIDEVLTGLAGAAPVPKPHFLSRP